MFLYRHAVYINLNLGIMDDSLNQEKLESVSNTLYWFEIGSNIFYKYLRSSGTYQTFEDGQNLISFIKFGNKTELYGFIENAIPHIIYTNLTEYARMELTNDNSNSNTDAMSKILFTMVTENCRHFIKYMHEFFWILKRAGVIKQCSASLNLKELCYSMDSFSFFTTTF